MSTASTREQAPRAATALVEEGVREATAISHPLVRARHLASWAFRVSAADPTRAAEVFPDVEDPALEEQLLLTLMADRLKRGDEDLEPQFSQTLAVARVAEPNTWLRLVNALSELAVELGQRDRAAAIGLLRKLDPELAAPDGSEEQGAQTRALACALVGEALLVLDDTRGLELLEEAVRIGTGQPGVGGMADAILSFGADALAERAPERSVELVGRMDDPASRLDARLRLLQKLPGDTARASLVAGILEDAAEHLAGGSAGPEPLLRVGLALAEIEPARARSFLERALSAADDGTPQVRSLQITGVAGAVAPFDREWSRGIFAEAVEAARQEQERIKRVTALAVVANEMAEPFPRESREVFELAMEEARELDAVWEFAHVLDVVFRADRSAFLDTSGARPLLEKVLERISDEDPRIPGVLGLPEIAQWMAQVDGQRALELLQRWFRAAEAVEDTDGMAGAAVAIHQSDPAAGSEALERTREYLVRRVDCLAMGAFSRRAAPVAPRLVMELAPQIPDRRERTDALIASAAHLYEADPEAALRLVRSLERPADRSSGLLALVDRLLGTADRPQPQPLLEEMP